MAGYKCPLCGEIMAISHETYRTYTMSFDNALNPYTAAVLTGTGTYAIRIHFHKCPNCSRVSILVTGASDDWDNLVVPVFPSFQCLHYPDYIPAQIRSDYEEASAIVNSSPRASATLARRCLQGMIHDFWGINKGNLAKEINELKDKIPADQWLVIDGVRRLGNIGAHMESDINLIIDIDSGEAEKLIKLIELLIKDWYINQHEQKQLYEDILKIDAEKQNIRHPK